MAETVTINVRANTTQAKINLMELGEKISLLGMRLTAAFTLPIVGAFAMAIKSSEELQAALKPVQDAFAGVSRELGDALVPLVKSLVPYMLDLARTLSDAVKWFSELDPSMQKFVFWTLASLAAIGPMTAAVGQLIGTIGVFEKIITTLGITSLPALATSVKAFAVSAYTALAPLMPLLIAIAGLIALINSEFGKSGITAGKQLLAIGAGGATLAFTGDRDKANKVFMDTGQGLGLFSQPTPSRGTSAPTVIYNNYGVDANNQNLLNILKPYINQTLRGNGQR